MNFQTTLIGLLEEATRRGYSWAHAGAFTNMSATDRQFLEDDAVALATQLHATPFDVKVNPEDQLLQEAFEKRLRDLDDAEMAVAKAGVEIRMCEQELADHVLSEQPRPSDLATICGTALFATGFAIGLYDWIHERISDPYLAGLTALGFGLALGFFVTDSIYSTKSPKKRTWGLAAGLGLSLSAGLLRYAFSGGGWFTTASLILFELAVVAFLDWRGRHLNDEFEIWRGDEKEHARRQQRLDAASQAGTRALERVRELSAQTTAHREMIASRLLYSQRFPEIVEAVKKAEVTGAQHKIAENQGIKRGVIPENFTPKAVTA